MGEIRGSQVAIGGGGVAEIIKKVIEQQYTPEEKANFSRIIKEFVKLYYDMSKQTWGVTKWRGIHVTKAVTDLWIYQELINYLGIDCVVETGTSHGGSALFLSDMLRLSGNIGQVISIDITHEKLHPLAKAAPIHFIKGSSVEKDTFEEVQTLIRAHNSKKIMVVLDSDHSVEHVRKELDLYYQLVSVGSALIVEDTYPCVDLIPMISEWLLDHPNFEREYMCEKFMLTFNRDGYLERVG